MIAHRPGVGTTGPFGQIERYRRGPWSGQPACPRMSAGPAVELSTIRGRRGQPVDERRPLSPSFVDDAARGTGGRDLVVAEAARLVGLDGGGVEAADDDERVVDRRGPAADEALRAGRGLAADDADRAQHRDLVRERQELGHRAERAAREVRVEAARDDVAAALAERLGDLDEAVVEELRLLDADEVDVALARERQDPDRGAARDLHRRVARLAAALGVLAGGAVVDVGADEQDPPAGDLGTPQEPQQLVGLARRHAAGDHVEPGVGAVQHRIDRTRLAPPRWTGSVRHGRPEPPHPT